MRTIYFITSNKGKVVEVQKMFSNLNIEIIQKDIGYPEIQAINLEDVALYGAKHIQKRISHPFILEDAGLFIDDLNGFPGVYSAYVYHTIGCKGILKLLENFNNKDRNAVFKSVFAFAASNDKPRLFIGECLGKISNIEAGDYGFGYDPIFIPDGEKKTFAQMKTEEKNKISHRGKSLNKLIDFFKNI